MLRSYEAADFDRAVALVGAEPSPRVLVERLGLDWDELARLARDASEAVLGEALRAPVTLIFEAGLAVGLGAGSGGDGE